MGVINYTILKDIRKVKKLKQYEVASRVGIAQGYYSLIEQGKRDCSVSVLEKICEVLGLELKIILR